MRRGPLLAVALVVVASAISLHLGLATYTVTSGSMAPTLDVGERVWAERVTPRLGTVHRGDVVVFRDPGGWLAASRTAVGRREVPGGGLLVKRVVGLPGERVSCCADRRLQVDGRGLQEDYLPRDRAPSTVAFDRVVPRGALFVLGDDREGSLDSRVLTGTPDKGFVPLDDVVGVVLGW